MTGVSFTGGLGGDTITATVLSNHSYKAVTMRPLGIVWPRRWR